MSALKNGGGVDTYTAAALWKKQSEIFFTKHLYYADMTAAVCVRACVSSCAQLRGFARVSPCFDWSEIRSTINKKIFK